MVFDDFRQITVDADRLVQAIDLAADMMMREARKYLAQCVEITQRYDDERRDIPPTYTVKADIRRKNIRCAEDEDDV